jgi:hypothetical protein
LAASSTDDAGVDDLVPGRQVPWLRTVLDAFFNVAAKPPSNVTLEPLAWAEAMHSEMAVRIVWAN